MFWKDIQFGVRVLLRQPAFTAVAVLTLALGIGANTAIFTLFDAILLQALPVREPARLVLFSDAPGQGTATGEAPVGRWNLFSFEVYGYLKQKLPFQSIAAVRSGETAVSVRLAGAPSEHGPAERAQAHLVSGNYFDTMGVPAAAGRVLTMDDDRAGAPPAAVASYGFWSQRLHSDAAAVGTVAILNGTAFTIVGIAPREFFGERVQRPPDFWVPLVFQPQIELSPSLLDRTDAYWLNLIGRLPRGVTRAEAQTACDTALRQFLTHLAGSHLSAGRTQEIKSSRIELADGSAGISGLRVRYSEPLHILLGVVVLVLLIACANVGNLLLSRAAARQAEMTVRMALGATRERLVRQLLVESLLLAALGAACGVLFARWAVNGLMALIASNGTPVHPSLDGPVLAFTIAIAGFSGLLFGLAPALSAGRADLVGALKAGGRGAIAPQRGVNLTRVLVAAQIAISLVLLVGASLLARSLLNLEGRPLGFDQDHVLLARVNPRLASYKPENVALLYRRIYDRINALPGVSAGTIARYSPFGGGRSVNSGSVPGYTPKPGENVQFEALLIGPSYAAALGMPVTRGRAIGPQDVAGAAKVGMVNEAFVRQYLPGANPIGRQFVIDDSPGVPPYEIVGVLGDARFRDDREEVKPIVFVALFQDVTQFALGAEVEIRTAGEPAGAARELRQALAEVDPNLPVNDPKTLHDQVSENFTSQRLAAQMVGAFGGLALLLACVGLYGVVTQGVVQRTGEIGVRMALGAQRGQVVWMILRDTLGLLAAGLLVGIPAAFGAARLLGSQLFGVSVNSPSTFIFAAAGLALVTTLTGLLPARRASTVDPMVALRSE